VTSASSGAVARSGNGRRIAFAVQLTASGLLVGYLVWRLPGDALASLWHRVVEQWRPGSVALVLLALACVVGGALAASARLRAVAAGRGASVSLRSCVQLNCWSELAAAVTPLGLGGDALRILDLRSRRGITGTAAVQIVVSDRVAGVLASAAVGTTAIAALPASTSSERFRSIALVASCSLWVALGALWSLRAMWHRVRPWLARWPRLAEAVQPDTPVQVTTARWRVLGLATLGQAFEVVASFAVLRALGLGATPVAAAAVLACYLPIVEAVPVSLLGIGVREGLLELALVRFGEPSGSGLLVGAVTIAVHLSVLPGLLWLARDRGSVRPAVPGRAPSGDELATNPYLADPAHAYRNAPSMRP
jgi:hypothetical protein